MSIWALGAKPLPETRRLVVGGPSVGESEIAGWLKQNPARNKTAVPSKQTCLRVRAETIVRLVMLTS